MSLGWEPPQEEQDLFFLYVDLMRDTPSPDMAAWLNFALSFATAIFSASTRVRLVLVRSSSCNSMSLTPATNL